MGTVLRPGRSGCAASSGSPESIRPPLIEAGSAHRRSPDGAKFISPWDEFQSDDALSVRWWPLGDDDTTIDAFDPLRPGWSVDTLGDGYEWHEARIGHRLWVWMWDDDVEQCCDVVVNTLAEEGPRRNPLFHMASALASREESLAISPGAAGFVSARGAEGASTLALLDRLGAERRLGPAVYVNHCGRIENGPVRTA